MENKRKIFGDIKVIKPILVMKFGLVYDNYKHDQLGNLWKEAEDKVIEQLPTFKSSDLFFQEEILDGEIWYSFRFYTPKSNIKKGE